MGVWSSDCPAIRRCPQWVSSQQSGEQFAVVCALDVARSTGCRNVDLVMDNVRTIAEGPLWPRLHAAGGPAAFFA